jgi:hypothetical protein
LEIFLTVAFYYSAFWAKRPGLKHGRSASKPESAKPLYLRIKPRQRPQKNQKRENFLKKLKNCKNQKRKEKREK